MTSMLHAVRQAAKKFVSQVKHASTPRGYSFKQELILWDFTNTGTTDAWDCISDRDIGGQSFSSLQPNGKGTGVVFSGRLDTGLPTDQSAKYSGYCAIRSKPKKGKWFDSDYYDVSEYDAFELRVRGDGRRFIINIGAPGLARKDDLWQCFLYTKGGPDWENIRLPFDEFFVTHRGYMQDTPFTFPESSVATVGLLLADRVKGSFQLEVQHIKAVRTLTRF